MGDETLIFQHIPKTGGITLSHLLLHHYNSDEVFHVRNPQHVKAPVFGGTWGSVEDFANIPEENRSRFRCLIGHMPFGIHQCIPGKSHYIAVLRDPIERILSQHGQYNRMVSNNEIADGRTLSLKEYLQEKPNTLDNHQTRFLIAKGFYGKTDAERFDLVRTIFNDHFCVVGILERFDETVLVLNKVMGWPTVPYRRRNIGDRRAALDEIPPDLVTLMREKNCLDFKVHTFGNELLDKAIASYGPTFETDLAQLRRANKAVEPSRPSLVARGLGRLKRLLGRPK